MTGVGSYYYIVWATWLRICLYGGQDKYMLKWERFWHVPEVVPRNTSEANMLPEKTMTNGYEELRDTRESSVCSDDSEDRKSV